MSIKFVILGYLGWKPMSGYDLKKIIADSETLPWSANNNQIYRALVELHDQGWVKKDIQTQVGAPDRHIYTITDDGRQNLNEWVKGKPALPQSKKGFLHQLMWADELEGDELDELLNAYREVVADKVFLLRVQVDRRKYMPERSSREKFIWDMIYNNWIKQYEAELDWVRGVRKDLSNQRAHQSYRDRFFTQN